MTEINKKIVCIIDFDCVKEIRTEGNNTIIVLKNSKSEEIVEDKDDTIKIYYTSK